MSAVPFTAKEIRIIRKVVPRTDSRRLLFELGCSTMLRIGDLLALRWGALVKEGRVREQIQVVQQKTGRTVRALILPEARETVVEHYSGYLANHLARYVFASRNSSKQGAPITVNGAIKRLKSLCAECGIDPSNRSCHSLRKTNPANLYRERKDVALVMRLLGHRTPQSTMSYLAVEEEDAFEALRELAL